jgi:hypothetical protein
MKQHTYMYEKICSNVYNIALYKMSYFSSRGSSDIAVKLKARYFSQIRHFVASHYAKTFVNKIYIYCDRFAQASPYDRPLGVL